MEILGVLNLLRQNSVVQAWLHPSWMLKDLCCIRILVSTSLLCCVEFQFAVFSPPPVIRCLSLDLLMTLLQMMRHQEISAAASCPLVPSNPRDGATPLNWLRNETLNGGSSIPDPNRETNGKAFL